VCQKDSRVESTKALTLRIAAETSTTIQNIAQEEVRLLEGFMTEGDYSFMPEEMRVADDTPWTKLRSLFQSGQAPPKEFMRSEVADVILKMPNNFVE